MTDLKPHTLYTSDRCEWSKRMVSMISEADLMYSFNLVTVESGVPFPPQVTSVPTVVAHGQKLLAGNEAFAWLKNEMSTQVKNWDFQEAQGLSYSMTEDDEGRQVHTQNFTYI
jgi:hypothetical protein